MLGKTIGRVLSIFALLLPAHVFGAPANVLNILGSVTIGPTFENFTCDLPGDSVCGTPPAVNHGDFLVEASTGAFAQYNGTLGLIENLSALLQPVGSPFSLPNFITFDLNNQQTITLTSIEQGTDAKSATCVGFTNCTPDVPGAPYFSALNLDQSATGTTLTISLDGMSNLDHVNGVVTTQFAGETAAQVLATLEGTPADTFSAQFILTPASVPEPATLVLTGIGLLGLGILSMRRSARR